jgi:Rrf2 family protein
MRISTRGRYSLEALLFLALQPADALHNTRVIAGQTGISEGYLEQLFISLRQKGLIVAIRGAQGGYRLGKNAAEISIGDILRVSEGSLEPVGCLANEPCGREGECASRLTWARLYTAITECADSITLADLVGAYEPNGTDIHPEYAI